LRVLVVCNGFPPSGQWGTEFYSHQLATGLAARGVEVEVLHPERSGSRPRYELELVERYGIPVHELSNAGDPRKRFVDSYRNSEVERVFGELLDERDYDVVHFTHLLWGLSARLPEVARARGVRTVVTITDFGLLCHRGQLVDWEQSECDGPDDDEQCARCVREPGPWDAAALPLFLKRVGVRSAAALGGLGRVVTAADITERRRTIAQCASAVDHWILPTGAVADACDELGLPADRTSRMTYGLDESSFVASTTPRPRRDALRFTFMSQYMPHKGLATLLEAVRLLSSRLPESVEPWTVELYGNGSFARHRRYAEECVGAGLPRRVVDHGPFEPLSAPEVLESTDVVLVPSEWRENAPLTVLQARAAGRWVIASDVPGVREVLEDGRHGALVPPADARALADAMGAAIRDRVRPPADPAETHDAHLSLVEALYRLVLERGVAPAEAATAKAAS
jgi:glycosyltransferase involved in cell wall biosynthesis